MKASPDVRGGLSRLAARVIESRFAKPIARVALAAAALLVLAVIGRGASAGAVGVFPPWLSSAPHRGDGETPPVPSASVAGPASSSAALSPSAAQSPAAAESSPAAPSASEPTHTSRSRVASADDPVILNAATIEDLRRLPGVGEKRANAVMALRARLGRFRAVEDLLKVKGFGRATLKRLRPLVRLDPKKPPDGNDGGLGGTAALSPIH